MSKLPKASVPSLEVAAKDNGGGRFPSWQNLSYQIGQLKNSAYCQGNDSTIKPTKVIIYLIIPDKKDFFFFILVRGMGERSGDEECWNPPLTKATQI